MDDQNPPRRLRRMLVLLALLTVLVLGGAALLLSWLPWFGERASEQGSQKPSTETTAAETKGKSADSYCASTEGTDEYGYTDVAKPLRGGSEVRRNDQITIEGWAATPAGTPPIQRVEVKVDGQYVGPVSECLPREDLVQAFGENARYSGWKVIADLQNIEITGMDLNISAEAIDRDGGRHPLPGAGQAESETLYLTP